jgi:hypothetical protein
VRQALRTILVLLSMSTMVLAADSWSPNGYPSGQCTYWCDGRTAHASTPWILKFLYGYRYDAKDWYAKVTNATKSNRPGVGAVMVLKPWGAYGGYAENPYGHVAYVEGWISPLAKPTYWVSHLNMSGITHAKTGWPTSKWTRAEFNSDYTKVKLLDTALPTREYAVTGFLLPR